MAKPAKPTARKASKNKADAPAASKPEASPAETTKIAAKDAPGEQAPASDPAPKATVSAAATAPKRRTGLGWVAIFVVIIAAGAGFATWPLWSERVVQHLPPGLQGWLSGSTEDPRVTGLINRLESIEGQVKTGIEDSKAIAALESERTRLRDEITKLMGRLESVEQSVTTVKGLVEAASAAADQAGASESLKKFSDRLVQLEKTGGALDDLQQRIASLEKQSGNRDQAAETLSARADERLKAAVTEIEKRLSNLEATTPAGSPTPANSGAPATVLAVAQLRRTVQSGAAYAEDLQALKAVAGNDAGMKAALLVLGKYASKGILTLPQLRDRYSAMTGDIVKAHRAHSGGSWMERAINRVSALLPVRRVGTGVDPASVDGVLARAEERLEAGDLIAAVNAIKELQSTAPATAEVVAPWLSDAGNRLDVERAMASLHVFAVSLLSPVQN